MHIIVKVNGSKKEYSGWKSVDISKSVENICGTFSLTVINSWADENEIPRIKAGDLVEIYVSTDDKKAQHIIMTGYVDIETPGFNNNGSFLNISGRDVTCDLVDCSVSVPLYSGEVASFNRKKVTPIELIAELIDPFMYDPSTKKGKVGLAYSEDVSKLKPYEEHKIGIDSKIGDEIKKISNRFGFLAYTDESGNLVLTTQTRLDSRVVLEEGVNLISASKSYDMSRDYSQIEIFSQMGDSGSKEDTGKKNTDSVDYDKNFPRYRPLNVIHTTDTDTASTQNKAKWIKKSITSSSTEINVDVFGWTSTSGEPYQVNTAITCKIPSIGVDLSYSFMIKELSLKMSESGQITSMVLVDKDVYNPKGNVVKEDEAKKTGSYAVTVANEAHDRNLNAKANQ